MRKSSARRVRRLPVSPILNLECLDGRALPSVVLSHGILNVGGTSGADVIDVSVDPLSNSLNLELNGASRTFDLALVHGIRINPRGGDDTITIADEFLGGVTVRAGAGDDWLDGGGGNDSLAGGSGNDWIDGGFGSDRERGDAGDDQIQGGAGDDLLDGGVGNDEQNGDEGDDTCLGGTGDDSIDGGEGDDEISGDVGNDHLFGDDGDDFVHGGIGEDEIDGGVGDDAVHGEDGDDEVNGSDGDDYVDGGAGDDACLGGDGDDVLQGGEGSDHIDGENGSNVFDNDDGDSDSDHGDSLEIRSVMFARLEGESDAVGSAVFVAHQSDDGSVESLFALRVQGATPGSLDVFVDGVAVGQVTVDGEGEARLSWATDPHEDAQSQMPDGFPAIEPGSVVELRQGDTVVLGGSFTAAISGEHHHPRPPAPRPVVATQFRASLEGSSEAAGGAWYVTVSADGETRQGFAIGVEHAPSGTYDVSIDGTVIGQLAVGELHNGCLVLSSSPNEEGQQQLPPDFPEIHNGSQVRVSSGDSVLLEGTFQAWTPSDD